MRAVFVPYSDLPAQAFDGLLVSFAAYGGQREHLIQALANDQLKVFVVGTDDNLAYLAVSVLETYGTKALVLEGLWVAAGSKRQFKNWLKFLQTLAQSWECATIETSVRSNKLLKVLRKLGAKVQSVTLTIGLENG